MYPSTTRREFVKAATASIGGIALATPSPDLFGAENTRTPVVDTHVHCFAGRNDPRFPYHPNGPYRPADIATPEQLLQAMNAGGVDYAVVVHPEPYQDDHRYLTHCLEVGKDRLKGTCLFFADHPETFEKLPALAKSVPVAAVRVHAYAPERLPPFDKPELRKLWQLAGELGLIVQVHLEPRYAVRLEPLIKEFPSVRVVIDHLGRPLQGTPEEHAVVIGWSKYPHTVLKISALSTPETYPHRDVSPIIKQLVSAYGADRLICGGGFAPGATGASYHGFREQVRAHLGDLSAADQAKVIGGTAAKLFGFVS